MMMEIDLDSYGLDDGASALNADMYSSSDDLDMRDHATALVTIGAGIAALTLGAAAVNYGMRYAESKGVYDEHPDGIEATKWGKIEEDLSDAQRDLKDYNYTTTTYIPMRSGDVTIMMPITHHHHHAPDPSAAGGHIAAAEGYLAQVKDGSDAVTGALDMARDGIASGEYNGAMDILGSMARSAGVQKASYIEQTQPIYGEMQSALTGTVLTGIGAGAAGITAAVAAKKWHDEQ